MDNINAFPGWKVVELLGSGAFSKVYKIRKEDGMGGEYFSALKVISIPNDQDEYRRYREDGYDDQTITKLFESQVKAVTSEFKLLSDFRGTANIVSFEDYKVQQKQDGIGWEVFIKMELLSTLPAVFMQKPLTVEQTVKLGTDICNALILCEQKKIIHRDIKPQNIFVNDFGDYKLGDFGIARNMDHATRATQIGTPAYMAPEVYRGDSYGPNVDIYSLGMVMYWALNERRLPFVPMPPAIPTAEDVTNAQQQRLAGVPLPPPKNGTDALKQAVLKACAFDPKARYTTAKEFKAALAASLAAPVVHTAPTAPIAQDIEATVAVRKAPPAQDIEKTTAVRKVPTSSTIIQKAEDPNKEKNRLKKAVLLELLVVICLTALFFFFPATSGYLSNGVRWQVRGDTLTVSGKGEFTYSYNLEHNNFVYNSPPLSFENVIIKEGITSIGDWAFFGCDSLTSVTIGDGVTSIANGAFQSCTSLTSITIPDSVTYIEGDVFYNCSSLAAVYISDIAAWCGIDFDGHEANPLYYAKNLYLNGTLVTDLVIPDSVTSIGSSAFSGCTSLTSITIPDSVTSIGDDAFEDCDSLKSITIPDSVTSIGSRAFEDCTSLKSITIPDSVTSIGSRAFYGCDSLTSITIPDSVTSIGSRAFEGCDSLKSITVPDSVTSIGYWAFSGCDSLTSVNYKGTKAQWAKVSLDSSWKSYAPFTMVHCTDGDVAVW